jgi:hypothetical protein
MLAFWTWELALRCPRVQFPRRPSATCISDLEHTHGFPWRSERRPSEINIAASSAGVAWTSSRKERLAGLLAATNGGIALKNHGPDKQREVQRTLQNTGWRAEPKIHRQLNCWRSGRVTHEFEYRVALLPKSTETIMAIMLFLSCWNGFLLDDELPLINPSGSEIKTGRIMHHYW